jgi:hypothetical protein
MRRLVAAFTLAAVLASGCEPYEVSLPETGATLEGTVTMGGAPVPAAMIILAGKDGGATGNVSPDGKFKIENAPLGEVKIGINTDAAKGQMIGEQMARAVHASKGGGAPPGPPPAFRDVPAKYGNPDTSGFTTAINKGANTYDIVIP